MKQNQLLPKQTIYTTQLSHYSELKDVNNQQSESHELTNATVINPSKLQTVLHAGKVKRSVLSKERSKHSWAYDGISHNATSKQDGGITQWKDGQADHLFHKEVAHTFTVKTTE
jgi:hypothetical protein